MTERIIELEERTELDHAEKADELLSALGCRNAEPFQIKSKRPDCPDDVFPTGTVLYDSVRICASKALSNTVILRHRLRITAEPAVCDLTGFDRFAELDYAGQSDLAPIIGELQAAIQMARDELAAKCIEANELRAQK